MLSYYDDDVLLYWLMVILNWNLYETIIYWRPSLIFPLLVQRIIYRMLMMHFLLYNDAMLFYFYRFLYSLNIKWKRIVSMVREKRMLVGTCTSVMFILYIESFKDIYIFCWSVLILNLRTNVQMSFLLCENWQWSIYWWKSCTVT